LIFYKISIIGSPLEPLTYCYHSVINIGTKVQVNIKKRVLNGVVLSKVEKPDFKTSEILEIFDAYFSSKQMELSKFISNYYLCSFGDAISIMTPFLNSTNKEIKKETINVKSSITLSKEQNKALEFLKQNKDSLLFGDTGSGKTEI
jgi:primosomal protein N' (replication factor Y)